MFRIAARKLSSSSSWRSAQASTTAFSKPPLSAGPADSTSNKSLLGSFQSSSLGVQFHIPSRDCKSPFFTGVGSARAFSVDSSACPDIKDPEILNVFKDFMASNWDDLPDVLSHDAVNVLSKDTEDTAGKLTLTNVFRAAEAVEEFTGILVSLRMELDDSLGISGENVKPLSNEFADAIHVVYDRYKTYLDSFGPDETYLKKKVEMELGTRMIHLKLRCSHIGAEWGKVTVLGTSGIAGSYVEQRG